MPRVRQADPSRLPARARPDAQIWVSAGPSAAGSSRRRSATRLRFVPRISSRVEYATLEWVDWFNHRRLLEPIGYLPPVEFEQLYYRNQATPAVQAGLM